MTRVLSLSELAAERPRTVKLDGKQIAVFRVGDEVHAVDNLCPHEGYPLATGTVKDGVLTCEWHNWKFRLCDGVCVKGGEDVRSYPVRIEDGAVWLDLTDPPGESLLPGLERALVAALEENDWGRVGRAVERMRHAGEAPAGILARGCLWAARHAKDGFGHGLAAAADLGAWIDGPGVEDGGGALLEALDLLAEPHLRRPERRFPEPERCAPPWPAIGIELRRRIEAEDAEGAEALMRGALAAGAGPDDVFPWLAHAATDHFLDYAHAEIYVVKAEELLATIGWRHADPILPSLVTTIVYGTREDRLPYMRAFNRAMAAHTPRLVPVDPAATPTNEIDAEALVTEVLDGDLPAALAAVAAPLDRGVAPDRIALALSLAASRRILRFDPAIDARDDVSEGWLDVTHGLTHADAVRETLRRRPCPEALRGLFYAARLIQHLAPLDLAPDRRPAPPPAPDEPTLRRAALADRAVLPIFVAHHVKTAAAALRLSRALSVDPSFAAPRELPVAAAAHFMAHPLRERRIARHARVSRRFVATGHKQDSLLGY